MILLDSSVIIAYRNQDDVRHSDALRLFSELGKGRYAGGLVTDYIVLEIVTVVKRLMGHDAAVETGEALLGAGDITVMRSTQLFPHAWREFKARSGTDLSFVDASSLAAMKLAGVTRIATFDREFRKVKGIEVVP
jgi:predicted nucleic acid-binding protein